MTLAEVGCPNVIPGAGGYFLTHSEPIIPVQTLSPKWILSSITVTERPNLVKPKAVLAPAGPAPTIITSSIDIYPYLINYTLHTNNIHNSQSVSQFHNNI